MNRKLVPTLLAFVISSAFPAILAGEDPVELRHQGNQIDILIGGRPFTTYYFDPAVAKPYVFPLRSAKGTVVTRGFPMVTDISGEDHDEPHQRALYFAHGDINGFDFWGEAAFPRWSRHSRGTFGRTVFRKLEDMRSGAELGTLRAQFDLVTPDGQLIGEETQAYTFRDDAQSRIIDCEFTIRASHGPVMMGDTKEGTFAIRLVKALEPPPGHMMNSNGATDEKTIWGKRADWVDYSGTVEGEDVGIAVFDNPQNFRHPTYWHARHYGPAGHESFRRERVHSRPAPGRKLYYSRRRVAHARLPCLCPSWGLPAGRGGGGLQAVRRKPETLGRRQELCRANPMSVVETSLRPVRRPHQTSLRFKE